MGKRATPAVTPLADPAGCRPVPLTAAVPVGRRVAALWERWEWGVVTQHRQKLGDRNRVTVEHRIEYDDGEKHWHDLQYEMLRLVEAVEEVGEECEESPPAAEECEDD